MQDLIAVLESSDISSFDKLEFIIKLDKNKIIELSLELNEN